MVSFENYIKKHISIKLHMFTIEFGFYDEILKLTIEVYKLNYKNCLGVIIKSSIPLTRFDLDPNNICHHPFCFVPREVLNDDNIDDGNSELDISQIGEILEDCYDVRQICNKLNKVENPDKISTLINQMYDYIA